MIKPKVSKIRKSDFWSSVFSQKTKPLYTYVIDICNIHTSDIRYDGLRLIPSGSAIKEFIKYGKSIEDIKHILEEGYDAPRKRKKGTIERWIDRGNKTFNAVVIKSYSYFHKEEVYLIKHIGKFAKKKLRWRKE